MKFSSRYGLRRTKENIYFAGLTVAQRHSDEYERGWYYHGRHRGFRSDNVRNFYHDALGSVTTIEHDRGYEIVRYGAWGEFLNLAYHYQYREGYGNDGEFGYGGKPNDDEGWRSFFAPYYDYKRHGHGYSQDAWASRCEAPTSLGLMGQVP